MKLYQAMTQTLLRVGLIKSEELAECERYLQDYPPPQIAGDMLLELTPRQEALLEWAIQQKREAIGRRFIARMRAGKA